MVTNFVNPLQKWGDSTLMQNVPVESDKWALPPIYTKVQGVKWNVFEYIMKLMIDKHPEEWEKGYIDLDALYQKTEVGVIKKQRETKLAKYNGVFKGRVAYMMRFDFTTIEEDIEITDDKGKHKEKIKRYIVENQKTYQYSYSIKGTLMLFENDELKEILKSSGAKKPHKIWSEKEQKHIEIPDEIMNEGSNEMETHDLFFFIDKILYHEIFDDYIEFYKENPTSSTVFGIMMGNKIKENSYKDKKTGVMKKNVKFVCDHGLLLTE
jgi:hypothetical protein